MVCGSSGTGKSRSFGRGIWNQFGNELLLGRTTFVNTLCGKRVLQGKDADDASTAHLEEGVRIKPITVGGSTRGHPGASK